MVEGWVGDVVLVEDVIGVVVDDFGGVVGMVWFEDFDVFEWCCYEVFGVDFFVVGGVVKWWGVGIGGEVVWRCCVSFCIICIC